MADKPNADELLDMDFVRFRIYQMMRNATEAREQHPVNKSISSVTIHELAMDLELACKLLSRLADRLETSC